MRSAKPLLPWAVWGTAVFAYAIAVINRSSLAALGPATQDHFGIDATTLSMFAVIQLVVYAGLQIPIGTLLDRSGPTVLIAVGALLMAFGQVAMATTSEVWIAILARVLVGAGDACMFISVMRLLPEWFSVRQIPIVSQLTGLLGQAGQLVSIVPLAAAVNTYGWTAGFLGISVLALIALVCSLLVVRDTPGQGTAIERLSGRLGRLSRDARSLGAGEKTGVFEMAPPGTEMIAVVPKKRRYPGKGFWTRAHGLLSIPGARLAYWMHFTSPFAVNVFLLLWGTPFLTGGVGLTTGESSALLNLVIFSSMGASLLLGPLVSRFAERRVNFFIAITVSVMATWVAVLVWPGTPPTWLLIMLVIVMPLGGPASMISFDVARSHTPRSLSGFSTGLVNTAGFTSSLLVITGIGLMLDLQGAGSPEQYTLGAFRWAFAVQIPVWLLGLTMIFIERRRTKLWMQKHGRKLR